MEDQSIKTQEKKAKKNYVSTVGRRREAVARVRLYDTVGENLTFGKLPIKKGDFLVNEMKVEEYFTSKLQHYEYTAPLRVVNAQNKFTITVKVVGGGKSGQLDAVVYGISLALSAYDSEKYRKTLKDKGFLTRDARVRERRKVGTGGKARRAKQSPKR